jgi:DNA-binding transcriptional MerR regulator
MTGMSSSPATIDTPDARNRDHYTITDLAGEFGVTARALRFYEDEGLIAPDRIGLVRVYSKRDRARLAWILRGKRVGFSLAEIREMIDLYDVGDGRQAQRRLTVEKCESRIAQLRRQRDDIDSAIEELNGFVEQVKAADPADHA